MDYKHEIDELIKKIKEWEKTEEMISKNNSLIKEIKTEIKDERSQLTDLDLRRMLAISEVKKEESINNAIDMSIPFSIVLGMVSIIVSLYIFSSEFSEANEIFSFLIGLATGSFILMLFIVLSYKAKDRKERMRITYIEIAIRELLDESKDEDKACNDLRKLLDTELQDFKNQNNALINIADRIEKSQNKKGLIDMLLGK